MRRAVALHPAASWPAECAVGQVTLAAGDRHRRRVALADDDGQAFLLDLPRAQQMRDGDGLELEGGGFIRVRAAQEEVIDIACRDEIEQARLAWHIGNRHVPVQLLPGLTLRVQLDHVLLAMLDGLGVSTLKRRAPFQPEPGAYDPHGLLDAPPPLVRRA